MYLLPNQTCLSLTYVYQGHESQGSGCGRANKDGKNDDLVRIATGCINWSSQEDGVHTTIYTIYTYLHRASQDRSSLDKA